MTRILAVLVGVLALLLLGTAAQAKPSPTPTPTPTVAPYALDQEIVTKSAPSRPDLQQQAPVKVVIDCPAAKIVVGGGFDTGSAGTGFDYQNSPVRASFPSSRTSWTVWFEGDNQASNSGGFEDVTGYAVCVNAS